MNMITKKNAKEDGVGGQGYPGEIGGSWRRDQVRDIDNYHQKGWIRGRDEWEEYGRTELDAYSRSRSNLISGLDSGGSLYDSPSKSSSPSCQKTLRERGRSNSGGREDGGM